MLITRVMNIAFQTKFDLKNAVVRLVDGATGTGKPNKLDIKVGDGNITFDETVVREYTLDRGRLSTVRNGDETPMDVSLDLIWESLRGETTTTAAITPLDALKKRGNASAWVSSSSDLCEPYALDIQIWYDPTCSTSKIENIILPDFRYEKINHDAKAGMLKTSGKCNAKEATITRVSQT